MSILENAIINRKNEFVSEIQMNEDSEDIETTNFPASGEIIIDVREELDFKEIPLKIESNTIINIPFFDINFEFEKLDQKFTYLLYCDK